MPALFRAYTNAATTPAQTNAGGVMAPTVGGPPDTGIAPYFTTDPDLLYPVGRNGPAPTKSLIYDVQRPVNFRCESHIKDYLGYPVNQQYTNVGETRTFGLAIRFQDNYQGPGRRNNQNGSGMDYIMWQNGDVGFIEDQSCSAGLTSPPFSIHIAQNDGPADPSVGIIVRCRCQQNSPDGECNDLPYIQVWRTIWGEQVYSDMPLSTAAQDAGVTEGIMKMSGGVFAYDNRAEWLRFYIRINFHAYTGFVQVWINDSLRFNSLDEDGYTNLLQGGQGWGHDGQVRGCKAATGGYWGRGTSGRESYSPYNGGQLVTNVRHVMSHFSIGDDVSTRSEIQPIPIDAGPALPWAGIERNRAMHPFVTPINGIRRNRAVYGTEPAPVGATYEAALARSATLGS